MYSLDMNARPCVCGHGSAQHRGGDEDEETSSGIIVRRAKCHATIVTSKVSPYREDENFMTLKTDFMRCPCASYAEKE